MGLLSQRVERSEIKPGDHIYTWRAGYAYSHHGIYVGGCKVVHFTRKKEEAGTTTGGLDSAVAASSGVLLSQRGGSDDDEYCPTLVPDCGFQLPDSGVILTCLDCFLRGGSIHRFEYGVAPAAFLAKFRGGTCTTARADDADGAGTVAVHRAMHLLRNGFGDYDVFGNNCEDFALYCKTGLLPVPDDDAAVVVGRSGQAASAVGVPLAALFATPFRLVSAAGPLGVAAVTAGVYCAGRYVTDIGVRKDVVKVEVEDLPAHLGRLRANNNSEPVTKKQQQPAADDEQQQQTNNNKRLLPLKRKRDVWTK